MNEILGTTRQYKSAGGQCKIELMNFEPTYERFEKVVLLSATRFILQSSAARIEKLLQNERIIT